VYPIIYIFSYPIYTFWIFLALSFLVFYVFLIKLSKKNNFSMSIFSNNILFYFFSIFFFSRLFYVISRFNDLKYIDSFSDFFATVDYNFSLFWAIFWFITVFLINLKFRWEKVIKYLDSLVIAFLLAMVVGQIWALLWWQVIWKTTDYWIELVYNNSFSPVSSTPVFPLAIVYIILFFVEFAFLYILSMYIKVKWFIAYIWLILFSLIILIFENFSWRIDVFDNYFFLNMNQIIAIILMIFSFYKLYKLSQISAKDTTIILDHK
jgi:hypothetical protein